MPAHRTQNSRHLRVDANPVGAPPINIISPTPQTFVFSADAMKAPPAEGGLSTQPFASQACSRSLPNLFTTFHASPDGHYNPSSFLDVSNSKNGPMGGMFTTFVGSNLQGDSPSSTTSSFFVSPTSSIYGISPPESPGTSVSPSPPPEASSSSPSHRERRPSRSQSRSRSSPAPYPFPLPPHSNGQIRTQPPRPPNPWICFRNVRTQQYKEMNYPEFPGKNAERGRSAPSSPSMGTIGLDGENARRPRQADLSKHISLEWKSLSEEEKAPYVRMSEEAKLIHARLYPGYKYQPRRKPDAKKSPGSSATDSSPTKKGGKTPSKKSQKAKVKSEDFEPVVVEEVHQDVGGPVVAQVQVVELSTNGEDEEMLVAGDPAKDWTWLPEQTLLPVSWEPEVDPNSGAALGEAVMNALDGNVDSETATGDEEIEFGKPFYLSFPTATATESTTTDTSEIPFFPFASSSGDDALFGLSNFDFQGTLGFHFDGVTDAIANLPDLASDFDLRRGSIDSNDTLGGYDFPAPQSYVPLSEEPASFDFTGFSNPFGDSIVPASSSAAPSPVRRASLALPLVSDDKKVAPPPPSPRRSSFACPPTSTSKPSNGFLRPPSFFPTRSRSNTLPSQPSQTDVRSIPTNNGFGNSGGFSTSVLIPQMRYDMNLEKDLEEYSRAMGYLAPSDGSSPKPGKTTENCQASEFNFEAEFADIIDVNASRKAA